MKKKDLDLKKQVEKRFDRYISTEDDNEFSPNFLVYMSKGLELYKDDPKVLAICGYSYPFDHWKNIRGYEYNAYPIHAFCAWGVGCWVKKRISSFVNSESAYQVIHSWRLVYKMFRKKQHITIHRLLFRNKTAYGDLMIRVYCALNDVYCIFPSLSKVRNYGFDGSGLNCKTNSLYVRQEIDTQPYFEFDNFEIREYEPLKKIQDKEYGGTWINRRMCEVEYLFFRMFNYVASCAYNIKTYKEFKENLKHEFIENDIKRVKSLKYKNFFFQEKIKLFALKYKLWLIFWFKYKRKSKI